MELPALGLYPVLLNQILFSPAFELSTNILLLGFAILTYSLIDGTYYYIYMYILAKIIT